ncbi:MAG: NAD(P)-dependent alcohol dehydrogenase [Bacteroidota bacterium]
MNQKDTATRGASMPAALCTKYGPPEVVHLGQVPIPVPKDEEVLIKVIASAVNSGDVRVRGLNAPGWMRILMRLIFGITKPKNPILGTVFAGIVVEKGSKSKHFQIGDEVYGQTGMRMGCHAAYLAIPEKGALTLKPKNASFEAAAALPFGGHTALYFLGKAGIARRQDPQVLIIGATGAVGTAALQIATAYGAKIVAVSSTRGAALLDQLGIEERVYYDQEDFLKTSNTFDIIFDAVGTTSKKETAHLLKREGSFVTVDSLDVAPERTAYLEDLRDRFEQERYRAIIDKTFALSEIVAAHRYVDSGRKKGNVVLRIQEP